MEHLIITNLDEGRVKIKPEDSFKLLDIRTNKHYSEAVVKEADIKYFKAV